MVFRVFLCPVDAVLSGLGLQTGQNSCGPLFCCTSCHSIQTNDDNCYALMDSNLGLHEIRKNNSFILISLPPVTIGANIRKRLRQDRTSIKLKYSMTVDY